MLQYIAVYCNILQYVAIYCNILQHQSMLGWGSRPGQAVLAEISGACSVPAARGQQGRHRGWLPANRDGTATRSVAVAGCITVAGRKREPLPIGDGDEGCRARSAHRHQTLALLPTHRSPALRRAELSNACMLAKCMRRPSAEGAVIGLLATARQRDANWRRSRERSESAGAGAAASATDWWRGGGGTHKHNNRT